MTEILSRDGAVPTAGLTLLRLDDLPGLDQATLETLRALARPRAGLALLVLAGSGDEQRGLPVPLRPRSAGRADPAQLTPRELEILHLLTDGLTNRQGMQPLPRPAR